MSEPSTAGWMDGRQHHLGIRVYFADTDAGGIVYHARYLEFAERGRTEFLRCLGFDHAEGMRRKDTLFTVRRCEVDYLKSARIDDSLDVRSKLVHIGGASVKVAQSIWRGDEQLTDLTIVLVQVRSGGGVVRIDGPLRALLATYLT